MKELKKINLAQIPTPLETYTFENNKFLIKRDDLTGCELSGNKIRKLEYLLFDAKSKKADIIFTCGGEQSNHARAVTISAKRIGLPTKLFLWGKKNSKVSGNLFLNVINNTEIKYLNKTEYENVNQFMANESIQTKKRKNLNAYVIPGGGSNVIGVYGYFNFIKELENQIDIKKLDGIVVAAGSGGTAAGLLTAISYYKIKTEIFAVNVLYDSDTIRNKITSLAQAFIDEFKLKVNLLNNKLVILDGYSEEGYKKISDEKIKLIRKFVGETGILFDPAYTGKAFFAYYHHFLKNNLGMRYLFVHTGGLFGVFGREKEYLQIK
jgi:D-cysteine desulfhydrase